MEPVRPLVTVDSKRLGFSFWLPLANLLVWLIFVAFPVVSAYFKLIHLPRHDNRISIGEFEISAQGAPSLALHFGLNRYADEIRGLEIPAVIVELPISRAISWPAVWHPSALSADNWLALISPFYCLPFCWLAGIGWDGLRNRELLHWSKLSSGILLMLCFSGLAVAGEVSLTPDDRNDPVFMWMLKGLIMWAILFSSFPALALLRIKRKRRTES
jgi:hypothetical protein